MNETEVIETARQAILIAIQVGAPVMIVGLVVGVAIALVQALTQIQEITLVFVPKILAILMAIFAFFPSFAQILVTFMETLADRMIGLS